MRRVKATRAGKASAASRTHLKLIAYDGVLQAAEPATPDYSHIITDSEAMRTLHSEAAHEVAAAAKNTLGTIKTLMQGRSDVFRINPYDLYIKPGWNVREMNDPETLEYIDWLAKDIAKVGVKEPYKVYQEGGRFYISNGHLRQHAVFHAINHLHAKIMTVPVLLGPPGENEMDRAMTMLRSNSGKRLSPWEQGTLMKRFQGWGWDPAKIAEEFSCSVNHIYQMLDLQALPEPVTAHVRNGTITAYYALRAYKEANEDVDATLKELQSAIRWKVKTGAKRVMPKHGLKARLSGETGGPKATRLSEILTIIRTFTVWKDNGEGRWVASMTQADGERLAKLTGMPVPNEAGSLPGPFD